MDVTHPLSGDISIFKEKTALEKQLNLAWRISEPQAVQCLMSAVDIPDETQQQIDELAYQLAQNLRNKKLVSGKSGIVQGLLQEFSLSSQEGIALMCLAEALLRIPDVKTRDLLIRDKINQGNWKNHVGQSSLMFVNAAAWGLMLTGKLMETPKPSSLSGVLNQVLLRTGSGIIRKAVDVAMRMMGEQFVTGETIEEALKHAQTLEHKGFRYSYDMLGEAALTTQDAARYFKDYIKAIHAIGQASKGLGVYKGAGISIKLSALHPRYQRNQIERVHIELYQKVFELALLAKHYDIGLNIDAEESERLEISLELLEKLCFEPELENWKGIGFVIQAYQKRCFYVVDYLIDLAQRSQKRLMIRLVKGAYWDSEIKKAQIDGLEDYPVFTRKVHTDLSYIACAKKLLAAPEQIYPQFATHNAQSLATIYQLANPAQYYDGQYEFQCLHGMGEPLYEQVVGDKQNSKLGVPCRIYAPVGNHETLLAYLVRRLLENGANTSFVNRIADKNIQLEALIESPFKHIHEAAQHDGQLGLKHTAIPLPPALFGTLRQNSKGFDLANDATLWQLNQTAKQYAHKTWQSTPTSKTVTYDVTSNLQAILNPALHTDIVGYVQEASLEQVEIALNLAVEAQPTWSKTAKNERAKILEKAANIMEARMQELMVLLCREAGKTYANAVAEVREAVDFLRYYAAQMQSLSPDQVGAALGNVLCISPWNFPLAIFTGQISAALVTGNCVIAKPAEQTPLVAAQAVQILHEAGVPADVLQLLLGRGETVGQQLSQDHRIDGIMFTGSTEVAKILQQTIAKRLNKVNQPVVLIAETGGQNAMIVDSSALTEQVVIDVVNSAFDSAGQRCSALRILCVQEDNADTLIKMLKGAMQQLIMGNPFLLKTDIGPVIDADAKQTIDQHIEKMRAQGYPVHQLIFNDDEKNQIDAQGTFVAPTLIEIPNLDELDREIFGPVLHIMTYQYGEIPQLLSHINAKGYGLTMGLHTRIDETAQTVIENAQVGNLYINRNIVGAVVGVQPFGGEGLSGTGPKAGGALYLYRLMQTTNAENLNRPFASKNSLKSSSVQHQVFFEFSKWIEQNFSDYSLPDIQPVYVGQSFELQSYTGETNLYTMQPRKRILAIAEQEFDLIHQLMAIFAVNGQAALVKNHAFLQKFGQQLPPVVHSAITEIESITNDAFDAVLHHGSLEALLNLQTQIAQRKGAIITITHMENSAQPIPLERLITEHAVSINTAAAGGNASLMTMSDESL